MESVNNIMNLEIYFLPILIIASILIINTYRHNINRNYNLQLIAKSICGQIKTRFFYKKYVEGVYKGRKVVCVLYSILVYPNYPNYILYVEPHWKPPIKLFSMKISPSPTQNTEYNGKAIRYIYPILSFFKVRRLKKPYYGLYRKLGEREIIDILEELTTAAEIIEAKKSGYY